MIDQKFKNGVYWYKIEWIQQIRLDLEKKKKKTCKMTTKNVKKVQSNKKFV